MLTFWKNDPRKKKAFQNTWLTVWWVTKIILNVSVSEKNALRLNNNSLLMTNIRTCCIKFSAHYGSITWNARNDKNTHTRPNLKLLKCNFNHRLSRNFVIKINILVIQISRYMCCATFRITVYYMSVWKKKDNFINKNI